MLKRNALPHAWHPGVSSLDTYQKFIYPKCWFAMCQPKEGSEVDVELAGKPVDNLLRLLDQSPPNPDCFIVVSSTTIPSKTRRRHGSYGTVANKQCEVLFGWDRKFEFWKLTNV